MSQEVSSDKVHPLVSRKLTSLYSWEEWLVRWRGIKTTDELKGLLHCGFSVENAEWEERLCFYLDIADGHRSDDSFIDPTGRNNGSQQKALKAVSEKAFQVLCNEFFRNTAERGMVPSWLNLAIKPGILPKILWFFRLEKNKYVDRFSFVNLDTNRDNNHTRDATKFLLDLCKLIWKPGLWDLQRDTIERLRLAQPRAVQILCGLRELDLLLEERTYSLDFPALTVLKELAMGRKLYLPKHGESREKEHRLPESLEDAILGGSNEARVLHTLMTIGRQRVHYRSLWKRAARKEKLRAELAKQT